MEQTLISSGHRLHLVFGTLGLIVAVVQADEPAAPPNPATVMELPTVEVIGTTPLPGLGEPLSQVPGNVQTATGAAMERQQTLDLADFMNQNLNGVNINETQGNPFQADVSFRGFTASPVLGTPEGLSVYVDGVRVNESFGDVVNWDLIPESAISTITLIPGSNPTFGLNTLGGALSVQTKSGKRFPGTSIEGYGGSFERRAGEFETGGELGKGFDYFLTGNYFDEDGWRDNSPSHVRQLFGKLGWEDETTDVDVSYAWADNDLIGNGFTPESMLEVRRKAAFTVPDQTINHFHFVNARASRFLNDDWLLTGNAYFRQLKTRAFNGDANDDYRDGYTAITAAGGACAEATAPDACAATALAGESGVNHRTRTTQRRLGLAAQLTYTGKILARDNSLSLGTSYDDGRNDFTQSQQQAELTGNRATTPTGDVTALTSLYGTNRSLGVYAADTWSPSRLLHFTAAARYNDTRVKLYDRIGTSLNGRSGFYRVNPSAGFTVTPSKTLTLYADYNEGSRAPSPIELGCADPTTPCQLPNALASDPPLKQVVARTIETGARGQILGKELGWSLAIYRTHSFNDIQFVSSTITGAGFFDNVGATRRQGAELGLHGVIGHLQWHTDYSFTDATYRSAFSLVAADNSSADANGFIEVSPGNRIPLVPRHTGRLGTEYVITESWTAGADLILSSGQYLLENNNNQSRTGVNPRGVSFQGSGRASGYAVLNVHGSWEFMHGWTVFARVDNVLDRDYATSGSLGQNPFTPGGMFRTNPADWTEENAVSPAAPRAAWAGLRANWR